MKILIVSATPFEILPLSQYLEKTFDIVGPNQFKLQNTFVDLLITKVGIHSTIYSLTKKLSDSNYDLVINAGIAGARNSQLKKCDVVNVISEQFGDVGIEEADGSFKDIFDLELSDPNEFPFKNKLLENEIASDFKFLPLAKGVTVNKVHGNSEHIVQFNNQFGYDVQTMEGAAFFFVCLQEKKRFLQIRSISNYVEERNKENWDIAGAISNLNNVLVDIIKLFS